MHPYSPAGTSPRESVSRDFQVALLPYKSRSLATPEGEVLATLSIEQLKLAQGVSEEQICPSGEDAAAGGRRGAFPRAPGAVGLFPPPIGRLYGFLYWRRSRPPQPSRHRRVKLKPLKNLRPKGPSTFSRPPLNPLNQPAPSGPNLLNPGPLCGPFPLDSLNNSC